MLLFYPGADSATLIGGLENFCRSSDHASFIKDQESLLVNDGGYGPLAFGV